MKDPNRIRSDWAKMINENYPLTDLERKYLNEINMQNHYPTESEAVSNMYLVKTIQSSTDKILMSSKKTTWVMAALTAALVFVGATQCSKMPNPVNTPSEINEQKDVSMSDNSNSRT
jgi:hypothetical protein